ncbi:hypothetical protein [Sphingobium sp. B2]|uniref:hypothetical protein n=1 Tax=Sphingobium sp. B2 TaxID=2583228 RepID=UPI0011A03D64|nr:hypothetical protein [Sphingobium sp. B2]
MTRKPPMSALVTCCALVATFAGTSAFAKQPSSSRPSPHETIVQLFAAMERNDAPAIEALLLSEASVSGLSVPTQGAGCPKAGCVDTMSRTSFISLTNLASPFQSLYRIVTEDEQGLLATVSAKFIFSNNGQKKSEILLCGDAIFTLINIEGGWFISSFSYTDQLDRARCRV